VVTQVRARPAGARDDRRAAGADGRRAAGADGRRLGQGLAAAGLAMIPWLAGLAITLPGRALARHWAAAWTGLDSLEALSLLATGVLMIRGDARRCLAAAVTAAVLVVDAWFDVTTAAPGSGQLIALGMAVLAELPLAALCAAAALRTLRAASQAGGGDDG
jgi:hypothetical protein